MLLPEDPKRPGFDPLGGRLGDGTYFINCVVAFAEGPLPSAEIGHRARSLVQSQGSSVTFQDQHPRNHLRHVRRRDGYVERVEGGMWQLTKKGRERIATVSALVGKPPINSAGNDGTHGTLFTDIQAILSRKSLDSTTQQVLVDARIGQGKFRTDVLNIWNGRCAVSGCRTTRVIRASHIKPWRDSTDEERLDPRNGLALAATWDALFDAGLITFDHVGAVLISDRLPSSERRIFDLVGRSLASPPHPQTAAYLEYHQTHVFR